MDNKNLIRKEKKIMELIPWVFFGIGCFVIYKAIEYKEKYNK